MSATRTARDARRFPALAAQVRCSSGFTAGYAAPDGARLRALSPSLGIAERAPGQRPTVPTGDGAAVLGVLMAVAAAGATLPASSRIAERLGPGWTHGRVNQACRELDRDGFVRQRVNDPGMSPPWRVLRIVDTGALLRSAFAPGGVKVP